jgi:hypothetical protein
MLKRNIRELTFERLKNAAQRRVQNCPSSFGWNFSSQARVNKNNMLQYKDAYLGKRCFVVGNGPSLNNTDLSKLKNSVTFGANRIYLMEDDNGFKPTFLTALDGKIIEQFSEEIGRWNGPKFIRWSYKNRFLGVENATYFHTCFKDQFGTDLLKPVWGGYTVTFVNLQLAYYMGFREVVLIGCDHSYAESGTPNVDVKVVDVDKNHFSADYLARGQTFRIPDYINQEYAFSLARQAFEKAGGSVVDATVGGKLQVFEKVNYCDLF